MDVGWHQWRTLSIRHEYASVRCGIGHLGCADDEVDSEVDGEVSASHVLCGGGGGATCVCCEVGSGKGNMTPIGTQTEKESEPWDPMSLCCNVVGSHLVGLASSQGTCCAGLCRQQCG